MDPSEAHSLAEHTDRVNGLCRLCGERVRRPKTEDRSKKCSTYAKEILEFHSINISKDIERKHSKYICVKCYAILMKLKRSKHDQSFVKTRDNAIVASQKSSFLWCGFDIGLSLDQCASCRQFGLLKKPGKRPAKRRQPSEAQEDNSSTLSESFSEPASTSTPLKRHCKTSEIQTSPPPAVVDKTSSPLGTIKVPVNSR